MIPSDSPLNYGFYPDLSPNDKIVHLSIPSFIVDREYGEGVHLLNIRDYLNKHTVSSALIPNWYINHTQEFKRLIMMPIIRSYNGVTNDFDYLFIHKQIKVNLQPVINVKTLGDLFPIDIINSTRTQNIQLFPSLINGFHYFIKQHTNLIVPISNNKIIYSDHSDNKTIIHKYENGRLDSFTMTIDRFAINTSTDDLKSSIVIPMFIDINYGFKINFSSPQTLKGGYYSPDNYDPLDPKINSITHQLLSSLKKR